MLFCNGSKDTIALQDALGRKITYKELEELGTDFSTKNFDRGVVFILADNDIESILGFLLSVNVRLVPLY